jgi:competence ComEA-like helix-hairpin-helix protein
MSYKKIAVFSPALILAAAFFWSGIAGAQTKPSSKPPARIDVNKATVEQLGKLPALNSVLAKAIVDYRDKSGLFKTPEDLLKVKGITKEILNKISPKLDKGILYVAPAAPSSNDDDEEPSLKPSKC